MPPVRKIRKPSKTILHPPAHDASAGPEEQLAISGQLQKKMKKSKARANRQRGIVVIRHLPHGFFEEQLKNYFEQFGKVTRLRLARSTRTGGSKGFAFIEFEYPEVAEVAAQTMDNYLMFQKVVKAHFIPPEAQKYNYFKTSVRKVINNVGKPIYVSGRTSAIQKKTIAHNNWTDDNYQKRIAANIRKLEKLKAKYAHLGIDFDTFTVKPNIKPIDKKEDSEGTTNEENQKKAPTTKQPNEITKNAKNPKSINTNKKQKIELKDLLESTIKEEGSSEDEEFIPSQGKPEQDDENISTSDEEDYGLGDEEEDKLNVKKKLVKQNQKTDRAVELLKRKPNVGGIQKSSKQLKQKKSKKTSNVLKGSLKVEIVEDINQLGQLKQVKKADFNKSKKKKRV